MGSEHVYYKDLTTSTGAFSVSDVEVDLDGDPYPAYIDTADAEMKSKYAAWKDVYGADGEGVHQAFDFRDPKGNAFQNRGPLYLIAGEFDPEGEQPVKFKAPKLFAPRKSGNSFYTSYCIVDGQGVLWYNDKKFYLCGRVIGPEWMQ